MTKIRIPLVTRPDEPNVNGITYNKENWDRIVQKIRSDNIKVSINVENRPRPIPVTDISYNEMKNWNYKNDGFSAITSNNIDNILGFVSDFEDNCAIVDPVSDSAAEKINAYLSSGRMGFMRYLADSMYKKDETIIANINQIVAIDIEPSYLANKDKVDDKDEYNFKIKNDITVKMKKTDTPNVYAVTVFDKDNNQLCMSDLYKKGIVE